MTTSQDLMNQWNSSTQTYTSGAPIPAAPSSNQLGASAGFSGQAIGSVYQGNLNGGPPPADMTGYSKTNNPYYGQPGQPQYIYTYTGTAATNQTPTNGLTQAATTGGTTSPTLPSTTPTTNGAVQNTMTGQVAPTGVSATQASNPFNLTASNAAIAAGNVSGTQAATNLGQSSTLQNAANTGLNAGNAVLNTAFDPQNALYNRTAQQTQDQTRVAEAARGITSSPYGAGVEASAMNNFNIDWQNAQLARQTQGLTSYNQTQGAAGTGSTTAANLGQQAVGQTQAVGQLPSDQYNAQQQTDINNWIAYMNQNAAAQGLAQQNYPNQVAQQSMTNAGGVPYIPQNNTTLSLGY